ncbi:GNAT family N-acetyltransferase [Halobacteriales archaeon Cl-PHB]
MPAPLDIRQFEPGDADRVRELHEVAMRDVGALVDGVDEPDLEDVEAAYLDGGGEFLVGEVDDRIVAMGAVRPAEGYITEFLDTTTASTGEVKRLRVDPGRQREGYGQAVYDDLERRASDLGFDELVLDTTPAQESARAFFEANGFEPVESRRITAMADPFTLLLYRKAL